MPFVICAATAEVNSQGMWGYHQSAEASYSVRRTVWSAFVVRAAVIGGCKAWHSTE